MLHVACGLLSNHRTECWIINTIHEIIFPGLQTPAPVACPSTCGGVVTSHQNSSDSTQKDSSIKCRNESARAITLEYLKGVVCSETHAPMPYPTTPWRT
jgi:hypothetical protein